ncbi:MAG: methyl-accepting chemotaxis protein [Caenispirillum bisanense]|nr:methyl-accepting chemotaxis protein [Caenispirillum bisanense]MCA1973771.1 methyl-accepting chemotaxis protein [Caenispirillum sp.]
MDDGIRRPLDLAVGGESKNLAAAGIVRGIGTLWESLAAVALDIGAVNDRLSRSVDQFDGLRRAAEEMAAANHEIDRTAGDAHGVADRVLSEARESRAALGRATTDIQGLVESVARIEQQLTGLSEALRQVSSVSQEIEAIAKQTRLLALNATIEAARAGEAGKGFGVVAGEVKALAQQTSNATAHIEDTVAELEKLIGDLVSETADSRERAGTVESSTATLAHVVEALQGGMEEVGGQIASIASAAGGNLDRCSLVVDSVNLLTKDVEDESGHLDHANGKVAGLMTQTQTLIGEAIANGFEMADSVYVRMVQETAEKIGRLFEDQIAAGRTSMADLFDEAYKPVPNTDPQQHTTRFSDLTDRLLPSIQEAVLSSDRNILFCVAVDRNGYLPTHNRKYSQPQGKDPVWNAANCRNRRIFNDPVGLGAGRNTKPFLLASYKRDMGGGKVVMMKDVSAPITVQGRHWGGFRMGYVLGGI